MEQNKPEKEVQVSVDSSPSQIDQDNGASHRSAAALKWGTTPQTSKLSPEEEKQRQSALENYYTEEEKEKMRKKGVNPLLKAEMEINKTKEGGFWGKVAGTSMGGGWIK